MRELSAALRSQPGFGRGGTCVTCRRTAPTTVALAKCVHCSGPFDGGDPGFAMGRDRFHFHCLRRLISDDTIRLSQALSRRSRDLIEQSRRRIQQGRGWPPLVDP